MKAHTIRDGPRRERIRAGERRVWYTSRDAFIKVRSVGNRDRAEKMAELFSENLEWEIAGDVGALPWLGRMKGGQAIIEFCS